MSASERVSVNDDVIDSSKDFGLLNLGFSESRDSEQLADISLTLSNTFRSSIFKPKDVKLKDTKKQLKPILLPEPDSQSGENSKKDDIEVSAFSGSSVGHQNVAVWSPYEVNATVIEQIFNKRSDNLNEMFPNVCPMPIALMDSLDAKKRNEEFPQIICNNLMNPDSSQDTQNQNNDTFQSPPSTPDKSVSKNFMNVLYNRKHRLLNLPMHSNDEAIESTNSILVAPQLSAMHNFNHDVDNLREFSIKSSHNLISWHSQMLHTSNIKQFFIKNTGGKKLAIKIEAIGPGFQLCPLEPFQFIDLQPQEVCSISITFCPVALGAAVGKLNFCYASEIVNIRKIIPLSGYGGHTVIELQGIRNQFLQLDTVGDSLNLPIIGTFSVYNEGPLKGVVIIRNKCDFKTPSGSSTCSALTITPSKCVVGPGSHTRIEIVYRPRKDEVRKFLQRDGDVLSVATVEVLMADEPSRQRILKLINKFPNISSETNLLYKTFRDIDTDIMEDFADFHESADMIGELFDKMKSTEIVLTVKRSILKRTIESEHDLFLDDTNESMVFHTLISDEVCEQPLQSTFLAATDATYTNLLTTSSVVNVPSQRNQGDKRFISKVEIMLNPLNVDRTASQIDEYKSH